MIGFWGCSQKDKNSTYFELPAKVLPYHDGKKRTIYEERKLQEAIEEDAFKHRNGVPQRPEEKRGIVEGTNINIFFGL